MPRVKRGKIARKKRSKILKYTKGFRWSRKSKERAAKEALLHAWSHAFRGRKEKKREYRQLWNVKISAAAKQNGMSYSKFIGALRKHKIELDRKILADIAQHEPKIFEQIIKKIAS